MGTPKKKILFLCTGNSCRSQITEGLVNHLHAKRAKAVSAGTDPRPVHPLAIKAMQELDIDISKQRSKPVETFSGESFDLFITLCDRLKDSYPLNFEDKRRLNVGFKECWFQGPGRENRGARGNLYRIPHHPRCGQHVAARLF